MEKIDYIYETLDDLRLEDIIVYDVRAKSPFFDYFVISSAKNPRQLKASILRIKNTLEEHGFDTPNVEGRDSEEWVLIDTGDIIINVFSKSERDYYNIEKMWVDVPRLEPKQ
ncbi:MAG: ribosome silencing factor [Bacillota bacterium]